MSNLKVIENELVPVYETDTGEKVVYGTELYAVLEVKSRYREWVERRIEDCEAVENEDFQAAEISAPSGQAMKEHIIKLDTAKEMAMLERNDKGKQVRRYFIKIEKKYKDGLYDGISVEMRAAIAIDKRVTQIDFKVNSVDKDLQEFKQDMPLLALECQKITRAKNQKVVPLLGGKAAPAYKIDNGSLRSRVYRDLEGQLNREFGVDTYKAIKRNQCDLAIRIIEEYELPMALEEEIRDVNAQMDLFEEG